MMTLERQCVTATSLGQQALGEVAADETRHPRDQNGLPDRHPIA